MHVQVGVPPELSLFRHDIAQTQTNAVDPGTSEETQSIVIFNSTGKIPQRKCEAMLKSGGW